MRLPERLPVVGRSARIAAWIMTGTLLLAAQAVYQPKFQGDPARSDSEANALGYMRVVIRAQQQYHKQKDKYASSLTDLVGGTRSFTRRMIQTDRGDYTVGFHSRKDGYELTMTPKELAPERRAFYVNEDGKIRAEEQKAADENSPLLK